MKLVYLILMIAIISITTLFGSNNDPELLMKFSNETNGYGFINPMDNSILISIYWPIEKSFLLKDGKIIFENSGVAFGKISPNGQLYSYISNTGKAVELIIKDKSNVEINSINFNETVDYINWCYDSLNIVISEPEKKENNLIDIYRINIKNNEKLLLLQSKDIGFPISVYNTNILYFLKRIDNTKLDSVANIIVKYNISEKKFETMRLPLSEYAIYNEFTISPDEKYVVFANELENTGFIYVIDLINQKILNKFAGPFMDNHFSWAGDLSYFIYSKSDKGIFKYELPKSKNNPILDSKATSTLHTEALALYKAHKDAEAVVKYEEALKLGESAQLYYDYANSLSNLKDRLEDSTKAYRKAIDLGFDKKHLAYYNRKVSPQFIAVGVFYEISRIEGNG